MRKPPDLTPPDGFVLSAVPDSVGLVMPVGFKGVAIYNRFILRIRREATNDKGDLRVELTYRAIADNVVLAAITVDPNLGVGADTATEELRKVRDLDWWKRFALTTIATRFASEAFDPTGPYAQPGDDAEAEVHEVRSLIQTMPLARRSNRIGPELLAQVAAVYTENWRAGMNPTEAVAKHFDRPYRTAARWVQRARNAHPPLLGPPTGPHGGTWEDSTASEGQNDV